MTDFGFEGLVALTLGVSGFGCLFCYWRLSQLVGISDAIGLASVPRRRTSKKAEVPDTTEKSLEIMRVKRWQALTFLGLALSLAFMILQNGVKFEQYWVWLVPIVLIGSAIQNIVEANSTQQN
jgi:hypothetical protein